MRSRTPTRPRWHERFAFALLRLWASATAMWGLALLTSSLLLPGAAGAIPEPAGLLRNGALRIGATLCVAGIAGWNLAWPKRTGFAFPQIDQRVPTAVTAIGLAAAMLLLPAVMCQQLAPLWTLWSEILGLLARTGLLAELKNAQPFSGWILLPVFVVLSVPALLVLTAAAFVWGSLLVVVSLAARSRFVARAFLVCLVLHGAMVLSCNFGTQLVGVGTALASSYINANPKIAKAPETGEVLEYVRRYDGHVHAAHDVLCWTLAAYAACLALLAAGSRENAPSRMGVHASPEGQTADRLG